MKKEHEKTIGLDIVALIFAPYFGQKVYRNILWSNILPTSPLSGNCLKDENLRDGYLELTHIDKITDEHALELSKIIGGANHLSNESQIFQLKQLFKTNISASRWLKAFQYLYSKSYALPYGEYSVENLVELNIITLK